jgi:hypothetical protein
MSNNIPAGFQIQFSSWENDGDNYKTQIVNGLGEEDVKFYLTIANRFTSRNDWHQKGFGNDGISYQDAVNVVKEALEKHPNISQNIRDKWWENDEVLVKEYDVDLSNEEEVVDLRGGWILDMITDEILGSPSESYWDWHNGHFMRVYDGCKIFYFSQDVKDETDRFKEFV